MEKMLDTRQPIGPAGFAKNTLIIFIVTGILGFLAYEAGYHFLHFKTVGIFWALCVGIFGAAAWFMLIIRRSKDLSFTPLLLFIPVYNLYLLFLLFAKGGKQAN